MIDAAYRHTLRRAKVHATGHRLSGGIIENEGFHPVAPVFDDLDAQRIRLDAVLVAQRAPAHRADSSFAAFDGQSG